MRWFGHRNGEMREQKTMENNRETEPRNQILKTPETEKLKPQTKRDRDIFTDSLKPQYFEETPIRERKNGKKDADDEGKGQKERVLEKKEEEGLEL